MCLIVEKEKKIYPFTLDCLLTFFFLTNFKGKEFVKALFLGARANIVKIRLFLIRFFSSIQKAEDFFKKNIILDQVDSMCP